MFKFILDKVVWGFVPPCITIWVMYMLLGYQAGMLDDVELCIEFGLKNCTPFPTLHVGYIQYEMSYEIIFSTTSILLIQLGLIRLFRNYLKGTTSQKTIYEKPIPYWQI